MAKNAVKMTAIIHQKIDLTRVPHFPQNLSPVFNSCPHPLQKTETDSSFVPHLEQNCSSPFD